MNFYFVIKPRGRFSKIKKRYQSKVDNDKNREEDMIGAGDTSVHKAILTHPYQESKNPTPDRVGSYFYKAFLFSGKI